MAVVFAEPFGGHRSQSCLSVLLVVDSAVDRATYTRYLQNDSNNQYEWVTATTWTEGVECWRNQPFDMVLLDLPDQENLKFWRCFQRDSTESTEPRNPTKPFACPKVPVVVVIEAQREDLAEQALNLGAIDYLVKNAITPLALRKSVATVAAYQNLTQRLAQTQFQVTKLQTEQLQQLKGECGLYQPDVEVTDASYRQLEVALKASKQKLCQILNKARASIVSMKVFADRTWQYDYYSIGCEAIFGYTAAEMLTGVWRSRVLPEDWETILRPALDTIVAGQSVHLEYRFRHKDGSLRWISSDMSSSRDQQQDCWHVIAVDMDISDRKWAEAKLQQRESLLHLFALNAPAGIAMLDREMRYVMTSQRWIDDYGLDGLDSLIGRSHYEIFPEIPASWRQIHQRCLQGESIKHDEDLFIRADGTQQWLRWEVHPWYTTTSEIGGIIIFAENITERKQAEASVSQLNQQLQQKVAEFQTLLDVIPIGIGIATDPECRHIQVNPAFAQLLSVSPTINASLSAPEEERPTHFKVYQHGRELPPEELPLQYAAAHGVVLRDLEVEVRWENGTALTLLEYAAPLFDEQGQVRGSVGAFLDISDRKQAELALQELNQSLEQRVAQRTAELQSLSDRMALALEAGEIGTWDWDMIHDASWDDRIYQIYGLQALGRPATYQDWQACVHTEDLARVEALLQLAVQGEANFDIEFRIYRFSDGVLRWIHAIAQVQRDEAGQPIRMIGINRDITARMQFEQQLFDSEAKLQAILNYSPAVIYVKDLEGRHTMINQAFLDLVGCPASDVLGKTDHEIFPADIADVFLANDRRVLESGDVQQFEESLGVGGREQINLSSKFLLRNHQGEPYAICGMSTDISALKQAEVALKQQLTAIESANDGIAILRDETYLYLNRAHVTMFGYSQADELLGQSWTMLYRPEDLVQFEQDIFPVLERNGTWSGETVAARKDGTLFDQWLSLTCTEDGLLICVCQDISDRKRAEQVLQQQAEREHITLELTQRMRQSLDLQTIFEVACTEIRQVLQADRVGIFRFYPEHNHNDGEFVAESVVEGYSSVLHTHVHDHCFGENYVNLYIAGRYFAVDDIYSGSLGACHSNILARFDVQANLAVPLLCGVELWGLLCVHQCSGPRQWQLGEIELTRQLASQLAIAIQQANLYRQLQQELHVRQRVEAQISQQLRQQKALAQIADRILDTLSLESILAIITQQVKTVMQCDRVIVFRLFPNGRSCIVEEAVAPEFVQLKDQYWEDETWSQEVLELYWQGKPRIVPDVMDDCWTDCLLDYSCLGQIQSKIVAPILQEAPSSEDHRWVAPWSNHRLWGILVVHACHEKRVWQESEAQLLQQIADQLAIAIQQVNLFDQLQQELTQRQQTQAQLTERNQQLAIKNEELARATRLKDEFLASMSHELRTPLNTILGMTEGLQEEVFGDLDDRQIKPLKMIERSGHHLLSLINDVLDVAKIESGRIELDYSTVTVGHLCESSLVFVKQQALEKDIQLTAQIPNPSLPIFVDERRICQVLINLLNNAVKFTSSGGQIALEVSYTVLSPDAAPVALPDQGRSASYNAIQFAVIDTGIGISSENMQKLFQPFVQIDSALNRQYEGTGLGLALVKRLVELHGGTVKLTSEVGVGTCFVFTLPLKDAVPMPPISVTGDTSADQKLPASAVAPCLSEPLILLVDDNEASSATISAYLQAKGYRFQWAKDGESAIAMAQSEPPDLMLMDIQMPGIDGLEVICQIRQDADSTIRQIPIIALTALAMPGDRERCLNAGANRYLSKPIKLKVLTATINQLLSPS